MASYRNALPQLTGTPFITDGGLETTLIFHDGLELPHFAAFTLLRDQAGTAALQKYFRTYGALARDHGAGLILESPTWRANADWGAQLGYSAADLAEANRQSIELLEGIRDEYAGGQTSLVVSGCVGPRDDGYHPEAIMADADAAAYHAPQIEAFADTAADMVAAITMTNTPEAIGITNAARDAGLPLTISFTTETDGRLPTGQTLQEAIDQVDQQTDNYPAYYMINCAHPTHFSQALEEGQPWLERIQGVRANASTLSHAELDEAEELDDGNPQELGLQYKDLRQRLGRLNIMGGCCGTDHRHIEAICKENLAGHH